jgi:predicted SAM-dependent methyltransferase
VGRFLDAIVIPRSIQQVGIVRLLKRFRPLVRFVQECQRALGLILRPYIITRYLRSHSVRKLQLGANVILLPGWLNTDLYPQSPGSMTLDATRRFPFANGSFDYVFSEHQMEHIPYDGALNMLSESHRILRTGGKIRIAIPSVNPLVELFAIDKTDQQNRYIDYRTKLCYPNAISPNPCYAINAAFMNWGHKFLYDRETLGHIFLKIGFTDVRFFMPGQSDDENLAGVESRTSDIDNYETMVIQAVRP